MKRLLRAAPSVVGTAALVYSIDYLGATAIRDALGRIGWGFVAILAMSGAREAVRALAWTLVFDDDAALSVRDAFRARLVGEALNSLLPMGFIVGEPVKAEQVAHRVPFTTAFSALMIEFAFYSASLLVLFGAGAASLLPRLALIPVGLLLACAFALVRRVPRLFRPVREFGSRQPGRVRKIFALEIVYHAFGIAETFVILGFISPQPPTLASALLLETVSRGVAIVFKMLPMRVGVDEASAAFVTNRLALGTATGLMIGLVRKLRALFWSAVGLALMAARAIEQAACSRARGTSRTLQSPTEIDATLAAQSLPETLT